MRLPSRVELQDFLEGASESGELNGQIAALLASSEEMRLRAAAYRNDMARVDRWIPDIPPPVEYAAELTALARQFLQGRLREKFDPGKFLRSGEFWVMMGAVFLVTAILGGVLWALATRW